MSDGDFFRDAKQRAYGVLKEEIAHAREQRMDAWFDGSWLLFPGAKHLHVQHLTLRRWRLMQGAETFARVEERRGVDEILFYLSPEFEYQNNRAFRRWRRKVKRDLRFVDEVHDALDTYFEMTFGESKDDPEKPPQKESYPWEVFETPEDETFFICEFGKMLGGADAVLDHPIPRLRQLLDWLNYQNQDPEGPKFSPGDRWRKRWDTMLEQVELGAFNLPE